MRIALNNGGKFDSVGVDYPHRFYSRHNYSERKAIKRFL